jgi:hypothetical protein
VNVNEVDPVYLLGNIKAFWYSVLGIKKLAIVPGSQAFGVAQIELPQSAIAVDIKPISTLFAYVRACY